MLVRAGGDVAAGVFSLLACIRTLNIHIRIAFSIEVEGFEASARRISEEEHHPSFLGTDIFLLFIWHRSQSEFVCLFNVHLFARAGLDASLYNRQEYCQMPEIFAVFLDGL